VIFTGEDLDELTRLVADAWRSGADRDWSVRAGTVEWSCSKTADHAVDTVFAPALFLASRKLDGYPGYGIQTPGTGAPPAVLIEALETAARVLVAVVRDAPPDARAVIWRRPQIETRAPEDFVPRGALELILHAHDVCTGLRVAFDPPADLCERLRQHTKSWPHWQSPGWTALTMAADPWTDLLRASGRAERPQRIYHLALRDEWDEAVERNEPYRCSTLGRSLHDEGFIHCSFAHQVEMIADLVYCGRGDVVLLSVDPSRVEGEVRVENLEGGEHLFPHVYGALPLDAVVSVDQVPVGDDGRLAVGTLL
jgi:uncharacterized protein (DUF952 family)